MKEITKIFLTSVVLMAVFVVNTGTSVAATDAASISKIGKIKDNSLTLTVSSSQLKKQKVDIKVRLDNTDSDVISILNFSKTIDKKGNVDIKIDNLDSGTKYSVSVKIKKKSDSTYSAYSANVTATTEGSDYKPKIGGTGKIKSTSVVLEISCLQLQKKTGNVYVWVKNNDSDSLSSRTVNAKLDKKGKGSIKVDNLDSGTEYGFKIRIKKSSDSSYSGYSNEKTVETNG